MEEDTLESIISAVKRLAPKYKKITGKPLGITAEVAEYEAARLLNLELAPARQEGYDATEQGREGEKRLQIKGRCFARGRETGQRMGKIDFRHPFDAVLLVILDENYEPVEILEATRGTVEQFLRDANLRSRKMGNDPTVAQFKKIAKLRWRSEPPKKSHLKVRGRCFVEPARLIDVRSLAPGVPGGFFCAKRMEQKDEGQGRAKRGRGRKSFQRGNISQYEISVTTPHRRQTAEVLYAPIGEEFRTGKENSFGAIPIPAEVFKG
jgi:hypothetical protein